MKNISKKILDDFQTRKTKAPKNNFINFLISELEKNEIYAKIDESGSIIKSRNIVIGDISKANVIFTAHYDTAPKLPFPNFITPKNLLFYIFYQILILLPLFIMCFLVSFISMILFKNVLAAYFLCAFLAFGFVYLIMFGKENKNTANDNTSGIITLCEIMLNMTKDELATVAFVFFDNEELGLIGSSAFARKYNQEIKNKIVVNFDCVSDGETMMLVVNGAARKVYADNIASAYTFYDDLKVKPFITKTITTFYPSDQMNFPINIGVAALKHKRFLGYYLDRIHTKHDTVFREENIRYLIKSSIKFVQLLSLND